MFYIKQLQNLLVVVTRRSPLSSRRNLWEKHNQHTVRVITPAGRINNFSRNKQRIDSAAMEELLTLEVFATL